MAGRAGIYAAAAVGAKQVWDLAVDLKELWDVKHREGARLTPDAAARLALAQGGAAAGDKGSYLSSLEKRFGLPGGLLDAVWSKESGRGRNKGLSRAGALGDFQFMPGTAASYGVLDRSDFGQSAMGAARMFRDLLAEYKGNLPMALAAYNEGSGNLARNGMGALPNETRDYVQTIMAAMRGGGGNSSSTQVSIGTVAVHTQATDAAGIAATVPQALRQQTYALQSNQGLM
jgi:soluble lytic murein transglycosylase-like protein